MASDADEDDSDGDGRVRLEWSSSFDTKLLEVIKRCDELDAELCTSITPDRQAAIGKELSSLLQVKTQGEELIALMKECEGLKIVVNDEKEDSATRAEFGAELEQLKQRVEAIQQDLIIHLLPRDEDDELGAILEVSASPGRVNKGCPCSNYTSNDPQQRLLSVLSVLPRGGLQRALLPPPAHPDTP
jgi:hypothetical protein